MLGPLTDTIVAPITGSQEAPVAIIRASGAESWRIARSVFGGLPENPVARHAYFGKFSSGDDGICILFAEGHSFTGEAIAEFHVHGSLASVRHTVEACLKAGGRMANPGEFSYRALMNGVIDLSQAEGIAETITSRTERQLKHSNLMRTGAVKQHVSELSAQITRVLAHVEAAVDFSEEIGDLDKPATAAMLEPIIEHLKKRCWNSGKAQIVRSGITVAIIGKPNAGKSSLLNALLQSDRAIVTDIAGTTRDTLEEWIEVEGFPVRLIDTAGIRDSDNVIEQIGIQRTRDAAASAEMVWYLVDSTAGWSDSDETESDAFDAPVVTVATKTDLATPDFEHDVAISTVSLQGLEALVATLNPLLTMATEEMIFHPRHQEHYLMALENLASAHQTLLSEMPFDLASVGLRGALYELGMITGETASQDILERIFSEFCIGK